MLKIIYTYSKELKLSNTFPETNTSNVKFTDVTITTALECVRVLKLDVTPPQGCGNAAHSYPECIHGVATRVIPYNVANKKKKDIVAIRSTVKDIVIIIAGEF